MKFRTAITPLALLLGVAVLGTATPASAAAPATGAVTISVAPVNSGGVTPGQDLALAVTIDNGTAADIDGGSATVTVDDSPFATRTTLYNWLGGSTNLSLASHNVSVADTQGVGAGESQTVTVDVPAAALPFGAAGVYPLGVTVSGGDGTTLGSARTAITWNSASATPVPLALAAPLTVPTTGAETTFLSAATLATDTGPNGILTRELDDLADTQVAIGIDPRIIASINVLGKSAPQSALDWKNRLAAVSNDTFPLAWADADLTVALQAGAQTVPGVEPLDYAIDPSLFSAPTAQPTNGSTPPPTTNPSAPPLPTTDSLTAWNYTLPKLSWPAENSVTTGDIPKLDASGINAAILSSSNVARSTAHATPTGASTKIGTTAVAVSDSVLSDYLRDAVQSSTHAEWSAAMTKLTSSIDQISIESSSTTPTMLATLDRNWLNDARQLPHTLNELYSQPWVTTTTLADVMNSAQGTAKIVNRPQSAARVDRVRAMLDAESGDAGFSAIAQDPQALTSSRRLILLSLLSNEWSPNSAAWYTASSKFLSDSSSIINSVQVVDSSNVLFLNSQGALPITVSNKFDQAVTVYITVRPQTTQLTVDPKNSSIELTIDANSLRKASVPVRSLSNGKVEVTVSLYSATGSQVGDTKSININVQAGWETAGTLVFGALVVALFGYGIFRNIRKRRRTRSESE